MKEIPFLWDTPGDSGANHGAVISLRMKTTPRNQEPRDSQSAHVLMTLIESLGRALPEIQTPHEC